MRMIFKQFLAVIVVAAICTQSSQLAFAQGGYGSVESLFLDRTNSATAQSIVLDNQSMNERLNSEQLDFDMNSGVRATLGLPFANCKAFEMSYFGFIDWDETKVEYGNGNLRLPGNLAATDINFARANRIQADYSADVDSAEFNLVATDCAVGLLGGFRYMSFNEFFRLNSQGANGNNSDYITHTNNEMYGGQVGLRINRCLGRADFTATAKGGLMRNDASQTQFVANAISGQSYRQSRGDADEFGLVGDITFNTSVCVGRNVFLRGGYNVMWIEGVALASEQLDFTNNANSGTAIDTDGSVFLHGVNIGLEFRR